MPFFRGVDELQKIHHRCGYRDRICEFHAKENGFLLGQGRIDFPAVRRAMDDIGYDGWIQIEGAVPKGQPLIESHHRNVRFMRTHFS